MRCSFDSLRRDLRFTARVLAARPGWTVSAILCLAIATGASTAAFTLVNGLLLRPLPFVEPDRLVMVALWERSQGSLRPFALREYQELAEHSRAIGELLARTFFPLSLASDDGAHMAQAELVSGNYFETLRVHPVLGRVFDRRADLPGSSPPAVLSHRLWQLRFGADATILGKVVRVNGRTVMIVGVAPPGFVGATQLVAADLWLPAAMYPDLAGSVGAGTAPMFGVMARLAAGVTIREAEARLSSAISSPAVATGRPPPPTVILTPAAGFGVPVAVQGAVLTISGFVYLLMALLMAVACANVGALILARGVSRGREIAIRLSLGASRARIARQLFTESIVLALAGCGTGTLLALWLTPALVARLTTPYQYVNYAIDVYPDARVLACSAAAAAFAAVLCGMVPLRVAWRTDVADVIGHTSAGGRQPASLRSLRAMVLVQFALSTALLAAAGMLVRSYANALAVRPAFDTTGLVAATLDVDQVQLDRSAGIRLYDAVTERLSAIPGVAEVGLTREVPLAPAPARTVSAEAEPDFAAPADFVSATGMAVSPGYFRALGLVIHEGRSFSDTEPVGRRVAVVNEAFAGRLWPGISALGRTFSVRESDNELFEVIGVVSNIEEGSTERPPQPAFHRPFSQEYGARATLLLRVQGEPGRIFPDVRRAVRDVNSDLSIVDLRSVEDLLRIRAGQRRLPAMALTLVSLLGLLLSALGLHGVIAYSVRERTREIGVRLAVGARPADIRRLILGQGFKLVAAGLVLGGAGTLGFLRIVRATVADLGSPDPAIFTIVGAILAAAAVVALYLPARWASRLEPAHTLRRD